MHTLLAMTVGWLSLLTPALASAQSESLLNGGIRDGGWRGTYRGMGRHGGVWMPALIVIALVILVVYACA